MNHERNINTIRLLAVDAVEKATSGHPGLPLGAAPMAYAVWTEHLRFNPEHPDWANRDRFVLSAGHGSALLYSLLYVFGYPGMTLDQLKNFRQYGSLTPGHPEYGLTKGVEVTTGPLGQGIANAAGIALAERYLGAMFNREGFDVVDFHTYVIASDGDLMEGVSSEVSSLAGHMKLNKLIVLYDDNHISIDGSTDLAFTEDVAARYRAYGWNVEEISDGNDFKAISEAVERCKAQTDGPSLIRVRTVIGYGAPHKAGTAEVHGSPLGTEELNAVTTAFGFDPNNPFTVEDEARKFFEEIARKGAESEAKYNEMVERYKREHPDVADTFEAWRQKSVPGGWTDALPTFSVGEEMATRSASGKVLDAIASHLPLMVGGSADLTPSNNTKFKGSENMSAENPSGRYIHYGVREHAMGAMMNGMVVTGLLPYGGTFLTFSDYMRPAIRLAALSGYPTIFVFTHDSIGLGEDGPTHQPIEHYAALRVIPHLRFIRPADANETAAAWRLAIEHRTGPTALALTRQKLPVLPGTDGGGAMRGAYILHDVEGPAIVLVATGSEVSLALNAADILAEEGVLARVVSMPCWEVFEEQDEDYKSRVLETGLPSMGIEAGVGQGWERYVDYFIGIDQFGASAPGEVVMEKFGFTPENVAKEAMRVLRERAEFETALGYAVWEEVSTMFEEPGESDAQDEEE